MEEVFGFRFAMFNPFESMGHSSCWLDGKNFCGCSLRGKTLVRQRTFITTYVRNTWTESQRTWRHTVPNSVFRRYFYQQRRVFSKRSVCADEFHLAVKRAAFRQVLPCDFLFTWPFLLV